MATNVHSFDFEVHGKVQGTINALFSGSININSIYFCKISFKTKCGIYYLSFIIVLFCQTWYLKNMFIFSVTYF